MKDKVFTTNGKEESLPLRGLGQVNIIPHSGVKIVAATLDEVLVVPGCRCDHLTLKP